MDVFQKKYVAFMESECKKHNCMEALPALKEGFKSYCESIEPVDVDPVSTIVGKVKDALVKYKPRNVDVVVDEETDELDIVWHSPKNSFPIDETHIPAGTVDLDALAAELDRLNVGHDW